MPDSRLSQAPLRLFAGRRVPPPAAQHVTGSRLEPRVAEIAALVVLFITYCAAYIASVEASYPYLNAAGALTMGAVLGFGAWSLTRRDRTTLWTALLWFRISAAMYFGVGTFLVYVIEPLSRSYLETFFLFDDRDVLKMNMVVVLSVIIVLVSAKCAVRLISLARPRTSVIGLDDERRNARTLFAAAVVFFGVGMLLTVTVKAPYDFGWTSYEVPGFVMNLTRLTMVGIFLIAIWSLQYARWSFPLVTLVVVTFILTQFLLFNKKAVLLPLGMFLLAVLWDKTTLKRILACGAIFIAVFGALQPVVTEARHELVLRHGDYPEAGIVERAEIMVMALTGGSSAANRDTGATALTRVTQVNAATLVIDQYDSGLAGDWPKLLPAVFVPRIFWPEKPIITDIGRDIYELGSGRRTSQTGAGVFADAYWAMGWWGVAIFMPFYGVVLGVLSVFSHRVVREGRWLFFPVALMGVQIGYRTDGHYIADVAGATVILVATFIGCYLVHLALKGVLEPASGSRRLSPVRLRQQ